LLGVSAKLSAPIA